MEKPQRIKNEAELLAWARSWVPKQPSGSVIGLRGVLGAGKTAFVRACVHALGGRPADVSSPTYVLVHSYALKHPPFKNLVHVDGYRLKAGSHVELGLEQDVGAPDTLTFVEWSERFLGLKFDAVISFEIGKGTERTLRIQSEQRHAADF